jgi:hypothetical protein
LSFAKIEVEFTQAVAREASQPQIGSQFPVAVFSYGQEARQHHAHLGHLAHQGDAGRRDRMGRSPDAETAIKEAIKRYGITDREQQRQLAARRVN